MGRKTNSNSLRIKKTNKDYNDCWYGDILYSAIFSRSLKIKKSLSNSFHTADISSPKYSLIGAQKRADVLLCYLDPKVRKEGCDKYNIKFHGSVSKNFCLKKKKDQNVAPVPLTISSIEHDALPTLLNGKQYPCIASNAHSEQATDTWAFAYKSKPKYKQQKQESVLCQETSSPFTGFLKGLPKVTAFRHQKGLCFHRLCLGSASQNAVELEHFFFPATANNLCNTHIAQGTSISPLYGPSGASTFTANVPLLSPQKKQRELHAQQSICQCENNNILTLCLRSTAMHAIKKAFGTTSDNAPKAEILYGCHSKGDATKLLQGKSCMEPTGYLQKPFSPHLHSFFFEKKYKKSSFFSFFMGICAFRKNFYTTGKNISFWSPIADATYQHKQGISYANNTKEYIFPLQDIKKGISLRKKDHAHNPIKAISAPLGCATKPLHCPIFLDKRENQAYIWNISHCYTVFWGSFLSLCFIKSNNEKASAHFLCCYVSYFLERKVLFRTIKQQLSASLNPSKQKKNKNIGLTSKPIDDHTAFFVKNKSKIAGIRISCSGRVGGRSKKAQRSRKDTFMWGETGLHVFSRRLDFAKTTAETAFGAVGIKAWICYKG